MSEQEEKPLKRGPLPEPDLSTWYSQQEVCKILNMSRRWLNERIAEGVLVIERGKRLRPDYALQRNRRNKFEPCYNPVDVDQAAAQMAPKLVPLAAVQPQPTKEEQINYLLQQVLALIEHRHTRDRGPWLTIAEAARETGLRPIVVRRVVTRMAAGGSPDVFRDGQSLKVRRAVLGELSAEELTGEDPAGEDPPGLHHNRPAGLCAARPA